jgi:hypothetical protein
VPEWYWRLPGLGLTCWKKLTATLTSRITRVLASSVPGPQHPRERLPPYQLFPACPCLLPATVHLDKRRQQSSPSSPRDISALWWWGGNTSPARCRAGRPSLPAHPTPLYADGAALERHLLNSLNGATGFHSTTGVRPTTVATLVVSPSSASERDHEPDNESLPVAMVVEEHPHDVRRLSPIDQLRLQHAMRAPKLFHLFRLMHELRVLPWSRVFGTSETMVEFAQRNRLEGARRHLEGMRRLGYRSTELTDARRMWIETGLMRVKLPNMLVDDA